MIAEEAKMDDFERTLLRSKAELPYPANYLAYENPGLAYVMVKISDLVKKPDQGVGGR